MTSIINVTDFGARPNAETDATRAVYLAIEACRGVSEPVLRFEAGQYHFWPEHAVEQLLYVPNNDSGVKRIALPLNGIDGLTVDGNGAQFVFHGPMTPVVVQDAARVTLQNFSIDWNRPLVALGTVTATEGDDIELEFGEETTYRVENQKLVIEGEGWEHPAGFFIEIDAQTLAPAYGSGDHCGAPWHWPYRFEEIGPRRVRLTAPIKHRPTVGNFIVLSPETRLNPGIFVHGSREVRLQNVTVHAAPAMALIVERTESIALDAFNVRFPDGKKRACTSTADATHFVNCRGQIDIRNCLWEGQLDDPVNIHGIYSKIIEKIDDHTIVVQRVHRQQKGAELAGTGDRIAFIRRASLETYAHGVVTQAVHLNSDEMLLTFDEPLPTGMQIDDGLENMSWTPDVTIRDCTVRGNRARGFLLSTPGKVLIENNAFSPGGASIFVGGDFDFWCESGAVRDITVRGNTFGDCNYGPWSRAVIDVQPSIKDPQRLKTPMHSDIRIENNVFRTFDTAILAIDSVDGFKFRRNRIERTGTFEPITNGPVLQFTGCRHVTVKDNELVGAVQGATVEVRASSEVNIASEQGFLVQTGADEQ